MECFANILCCASAIVAAGIASVATLCSSSRNDTEQSGSRRSRRRGKSMHGCLERTVDAIARATGYNNIVLRVFSNPSFQSLKDWDTDSGDSDDDSCRPSTSTAPPAPRRSGVVRADEKGKSVIVS